VRIALIADHKTGYYLKQYLFSVLNFYFFFSRNIRILNLTFYSRYIDQKNNKFDKCILFVRDPKKIILSSYYYHLKCKETWSLIENDINNYIRLIYQKEKEAAKVIDLFYKSDLTINSKLSYQKILKDLPELDGLKFDFLKSSIFTIHHMEALLKNSDYNKYLIIDCDRFAKDPSVDFKRIETRLFPNLNTERITKIYKKKLDINKNIYNNHKTDSSKKDLPEFINNIYQEKFPELDSLYNKVINLSYLNNE
jgi:hypothetical protein